MHPISLTSSEQNPTLSFQNASNFDGHPLNKSLLFLFKMHPISWTSSQQNPFFFSKCIEFHWHPPTKTLLCFSHFLFGTNTQYITQKNITESEILYSFCLQEQQLKTKQGQISMHHTVFYIHAQLCAWQGLCVCRDKVLHGHGWRAVPPLQVSRFVNG